MFTHMNLYARPTGNGLRIKLMILIKDFNVFY
jgi:hypothetical protein